MGFQSKEAVTFIQFSDKLLTPNSIMRDYYRKAYTNMDGYYFPEHYMEIPFWIPTIAGILPDRRYDKSLHIVENLDASIEFLREKPENEKMLFSVMDASVRQTHHIAQNVDRQMIMGGYVNPSEFLQYHHVRYVNALGELTEVFEVQLDSPSDYRLYCTPDFGPHAKVT
jgi:hypothetical protein